MFGWLMVLTSLTIAASNAVAAPTAIRPQNKRLRELVDVAADRSETFRSLVATLDNAHVLVYVIAGTCDTRRREACLPHHVVVSGEYRILQVVMRDDMPLSRGAGVLAHELQHAVEVAEGGVSDTAGITKLYERIGYGCEQQHSGTCYETDTARDVQARVVEEVARNRSVVSSVTPPAPASRVRALDTVSRQILDAGLACSPALARMVAELESSTLIVGVQTRAFDNKTRGRISVVTSSAEARYLRIGLTIPNGKADLISTLGHELRHALEIAAAADVTDERSRASLYRAIGYPTADGRYFDTTAAVEAGLQVASEIAKCPSAR